MGAIRPFLARWRWWVTARAAKTSSIGQEPWLSCQRAVAWLEAQSWPTGDAFCATLGELETGSVRVQGAAQLNVAALARSMRLTWTFEAAGELGPTAAPTYAPPVRATVGRIDRAARVSHGPRPWSASARRPR